MKRAMVSPGRLLVFLALFLCLENVWCFGATNQPAKIKPADLKISGYGLLGNRELKRTLRTIELGGKEPEFFSASFVEDSALIISSRVKRDGYLHPKINITLWRTDGAPITADADSLLDNPLPRPLRITKASFQIHPGVLYYFQSLEFTGLGDIAPKAARSYFVETDVLLSTKRGRAYTPEGLRRGLSSLKDILERQGYQDAEVQAGKAQLNDLTGEVSVSINVQRGPRYYIRSIREEFVGTGRTNQNRTITPNRPYSRIWLQDFQQSIKTNEYHRGFPDTTVEIQTLPPRTTGDETNKDLLATVKPGPQVHVGTVEFSGSKRTRQSLLRRSVRIKRGDLLDPTRTEEGRYRLARLGIFDTVDLDYHPEDEKTRDVLYKVHEAKQINVSLLMGWGSYELLRGGVEVEANNLWGEAHHIEMKAIQSFKASSGDFTYTVPQFNGKDVDLFVNGSALHRQEVDFTRLEYGGGAGLHKYLPNLATDVSARYTYQILSASDFSSVQEVASEGLTNPAVGSITFEVKHDRRDNPLYPTHGYKVFFTLETATRYLGGDASYLRLEISPSWYHPLGGGLFLNLGLSHGIVDSFGSPQNNLPFNKRFFPGGATSIRGYREGEASPINQFGQLIGAETYLLGSVELEQALTTKWSLVVFSDNLGFAKSLDHYPFDTGLFSVGAGIRWRSLIGPVRLEYGYNLNPRPVDPVGTLQFSLGFPF